MVTDHDPWIGVEPWLRITSPDACASVRQLLPSPGLTFTAWLSGHRMRDSDGLLLQFFDEFKLPDYFGWNFPALNDCLRDLSWLPAEHYVLVIDEAHELLVDEPEALPEFLDMLLRTGQEWSRVERVDGSSQARFRTILTCDGPGVAHLQSAASKT
ncbi:barstar family protein [Streptomyces sp. AC536]|uniref:barstar family protein n=1 Tax=Streptomyces buecherae TaxID=2763006 RepID=UPI00164DB1F0|nr:barstar family protein [Streptomyces buecherae]MBC3981606.1 barstar family protein [Streptomyces buecherae]QNJ41818.1 barstar family protein [Streptomyces buecherae]